MFGKLMFHDWMLFCECLQRFLVYVRCPAEAGGTYDNKGRIKKYKMQETAFIATAFQQLTQYISTEKENETYTNIDSTQP